MVVGGGDDAEFHRVDPKSPLFPQAFGQAVAGVTPAGQAAHQPHAATAVGIDGAEDTFEAEDGVERAVPVLGSTEFKRVGIDVAAETVRDWLNSQEEVEQR